MSLLATFERFWSPFCDGGHCLVVVMEEEGVSLVGAGDFVDLRCNIDYCLLDLLLSLN